MLPAIRLLNKVEIKKIYTCFNERLKLIMPEKLMLRSMIIFIAPVLLLQLLTVFVFLQNERDKITEKLAIELVRELSLLVSIFETNPPQNYDKLVELVSNSLDVKISYSQEGELDKTSYNLLFDVLESNINAIIKDKIKSPYFVSARGPEDWIEVGIVLDNGYTIKVKAQQSRTDLTSTFAFAMLIFLSSFLLVSVAVFLMRNQIKPIEKLSQSMHAFGRGQQIPTDFRVRGAKEIQQAGIAFLKMKHRIERQWEERRNFLAGISHDLRTMITRLRLQVSLLKKSRAIGSLTKDLNEMQKMVESYLSFMREDTDEETHRTNISELIQDIINHLGNAGKTIRLDVKKNIFVNLRPTSIKRAIMNVLLNATRHATQDIRVSVRRDNNYIYLMVHDDGPGIADEHKEDVFKPFFRLDEARNLDFSGSGLGLSIARDSILSHGGRIVLRDSKILGGLQVDMRFPV